MAAPTTPQNTATTATPVAADTASHGASRANWAPGEDSKPQPVNANMNQEAKAKPTMSGDHSSSRVPTPANVPDGAFSFGSLTTMSTLDCPGCYEDACPPMPQGGRADDRT